MGLDGTDIPEFSWIEPVLKKDRLVYIGLRDIDAGERKILKEQSEFFLLSSHNHFKILIDSFSIDIKCFSMYHVDKWGIGKVVEMALDHVNPDRNRPIHLSFDVDALDPSVAPSTGTAVSFWSTED